MGFFVGMALGVRAPFKLPIKQKHFRSAATNGSGEQLDQLAKGEVWVQNPLHRANKKAHGSSMGFFVGMVLGVRAPYMYQHPIP